MRHVHALAASESESETILHDFGGVVNGTADGWQPWGSLTPVVTSAGTVIFGRTLYGGSSQDGVIFEMNPDGSDYQIVHSFAGGPDDGSQPHHDQMRQEGNVLYGTTLLGGSANQGVVFSINTNGTGFQVLHSFQGGKHDGAQPHSCPMPDGSILYGLTARGGKDNEGTIYEMNTDGSGFQVLHSFKKSDGAQPHGYVIVSGGYLYGMTRKDGGKKGHDDGTIFSYDLSTNTYTVLHKFKGGTADGSTPDHGGLTLIGNTLYGVTTEGGGNGEFDGGTGDGVLFSVSTSGADFQVLHSFGGVQELGPPGAIIPDGSGPHGSLTLGTDGVTLYGMTSDGGMHGDGTIFQFDTANGAYQSFYNFAGPADDGQDGLDNVFILNGKIYGMTKYGGDNATVTSDGGKSTYQDGVIFSIPVPASLGTMPAAS